jgi:DUF917 family protein
MMRFTVADLGPLARGAALLGTGGGGDPHVGRLLAEQALAAHGPVDVADLGEVPDDAVVVPVAMMGAPTVMVEKLPSAAQVAQAVTALADYRGLTPTHLACIEAGGVNSTIPFVAAAKLGLPLVDGDGMGRAFPELQMVLPTLEHIEATPMSIADEKGNRAVFDTIDNHWAERLARTATVDMGCSTIVSLYAMSGQQCRRSFVPGTLSLCRELGGLVTAARRVGNDPVAAVASRLGGRIIFEGKVIDVARRTATGFARGEATLAGAGADAGHGLMLHFQNEHLLAERDGTPVVSTPDLIIVAETDSGEAVTTEALRYGQRVRVIAAPADPRWHTPAGVALAGPRYFGYDIDPMRARRMAVSR